jgi:hypothetical protein
MTAIISIAGSLLLVLTVSIPALAEPGDGRPTSSSPHLEPRTKDPIRLGPNKDRLGSAKSPVRAIPWMDRAYDFGDGDTCSFSGGYYSDLDRDGHCNVCMHIRGVTFGDIDSDGQEEALLVVSTNLGGAGTTIYGYIFGLDKGSPVLRATIEGGDRGEGGIESMKVEDGHVVVRRFAVSTSDLDGGACCPNRIEIERWRWVGNKLVQVGAPRVIRRSPRPWYLSR